MVSHDSLTSHSKLANGHRVPDLEQIRLGRAWDLSERPTKRLREQF
jgi:hypothetical protein